MNASHAAGDQSMPSSARSRLTSNFSASHSGSLGDLDIDGQNGLTSGGAGTPMHPLNLTGLKKPTRKSGHHSVSGPQRVPHNAPNAPPQALRARASLEAGEAVMGMGGPRIVAPRPEPPYVSSIAAFKTPALPFSPSTPVPISESVHGRIEAHISTETHSKDDFVPSRLRQQQQNPYNNSPSDISDAPDDSGYASFTGPGQVEKPAHTPTSGPRKRRAVYVGLDVDEVEEYGDGEGKRFRYDASGEELDERTEFLEPLNDQQQPPSRRGSGSDRGPLRDSPAMMHMMRPPSVVGYQRSGHGQGQGQGQNKHLARMAFFEAVVGMDVELDEEEIEMYARSYERYRARWTQDKEGENGHRLGLEEWDKGGDELVEKFQRVVKLVYLLTLRFFFYLGSHSLITCVWV